MKPISQSRILKGNFKGQILHGALYKGSEESYYHPCWLWPSNYSLVPVCYEVVFRNILVYLESLIIYISPFFFLIILQFSFK